MELVVWTRYSAASQANAEHLFVESQRDWHELLRKVIPDESAALAARLEEDAKEAGWEGVRDLFTDVRQIAAGIGFSDFTQWNQIFSKFAHPTIGSLFAKEQNEMFRKGFATMAESFYLQISHIVAVRPEELSSSNSSP